MSKDRTLLEVVAAMTGAVVLFVGAILAVIPIDLGLAWMRAKIWNWFFVPYLHLPHMSTWLMFAIVLFVSMFRPSSRSLKSEIYKESFTVSLISAWVIEGLAFAILYGVHLWALKG